MSNLKLVGIEFELIWENPSANRTAFEKKIRSVVGVCDVVVLPENFTTGFSMNIDNIDSWGSGETIDWLKSLCRELNVEIMGSVAFNMGDGTARNRGVFVKPDGYVSIYDKKHLFTLGGENDNYIAGDKRTVVEFKGWRILLQICYDLRFPVFSRNNPADVYDAILYVANWPMQRVHAWRTLLQARAIENQCYVMGVNRCGEDPGGNVYTGDSLGVNPWGQVVSEGPVVKLECEREKLDEFRRKYPFIEDGVGV